MSVLLLCAAILSGCGSDDTTPSAEDTSSAASTDETTTSTGYTGPTGEISFCTWGSDAEIATDEELVELYMETHPGTTVTLEVFNQDYSKVVETRYLGGESPDIIYGHPATLLKWMQEGMLMDLSDIYAENDYLWDKEHYITELYDAYKLDGKYFATLNGADTFVVFYNKTMIEEAGLECPPATGWTWDEMIDLANALTTYNDDGTIKTIGLANSYGPSLPIIYAMGGSVLDDMINPTEVTIDNPATVEAFKFLQDGTNKYGFMPDDTDSEYLTGGFQAGDIGMRISGVYDIVWMTAIEDFEWDICMLPGAMESPNSVGVLYAGYGVSNQTKNPELAKDFALWLMSYEAQHILAGTGLITVINKDVSYSDEILDIPGAPENHYLRVDSLPYSVNIQAQLLCWGEMNSIYSSYMDQLKHEQITPEDCAKAIQAEWEVLVAEELASRDK